MAKTEDIQFRILIPFQGGKLFDGNEYWAETCFAIFMLNVYFPNKDDFKWFWFTRYQMPLEKDAFIKKYIKSDKKFYRKIEKSKKDYEKDLLKQMDGDEYRCIYIRMSVDKNKKDELKKSIEDCAEKHGYKAVNFEPYNLVGDLGSDRFSPPRFNDKRLDKNLKVVRANEIVQYMFSVCKMFFWSLKKDSNGCYVPEKNNEPCNSTSKSTLESYHHMFCNITDVPLYVFEKDGEVGTKIYPNETWERDEKNLNKKEIKF